MPFWWYRRRKPWFGRWRRRNTRRKNYTRRRKRRRPYTRRRTRRTTKGRRRRRYKVRRKQKKLFIQQWQPECIRKCKIKGTSTIVLGAQGTQPRCYTVYKDEWTNPKNPCGGGFGVELITLQYLYKEHLYKNNIWTTSNDYWDLCRYTGCKIDFYRHPETDFIIVYDNQPPFTINKYTYMMCHPHMLLQRKHKKILLSKETNPKGPLKKRFRIRPPKTMKTSWFFQEEFANQGLVTLIASACNFRYPWLGCCNENQIITLYYIQPTFYKDTDWAQARTTTLTYKPYSNIPETLTFKYYDNNKPQEYTMNHSLISTYDNSIGYDNGWFCSKVLRAYQVKQGQQEFGMTPCGILRYNPVIDSGEKNRMWLTSIVTGHWKVPAKDELIMEGYPLWLMLYGYTSYIKHVLKDDSYFTGYMLVIQSPALYRVSGLADTQFYPILDKNFIDGKDPGGITPVFKTTKHWYPTLRRQLESIAQIVNCGPLTPKYDQTRNSTWQCNYFYSFYFKWGGSRPPQAEAEDPATKGKYPTANNIPEGIQIADPLKQTYQTVFKTWDYRRGSITKKALKRMYEHLSADETLSTDSESYSSPKKKKTLPLLQDPKKENKKIQECLLSLCEENISQEPQESVNLYNLIKQQQQQQQQLKYNLLTLISDLKSKQRTLLHQQGLLN
nr:MAG: ORF1 [Torque teno midi virus]